MDGEVSVYELVSWSSVFMCTRFCLECFGLLGGVRYIVRWGPLYSGGGGGGEVYNVASTIRELEFKGYPKSSWRNPLFKAVERSGCLSGAQVASLLRDPS